jgi:hypothetical protein
VVIAVEFFSHVFEVLLKSSYNLLKSQVMITVALKDGLKDLQKQFLCSRLGILLEVNS